MTNVRDAARLAHDAGLCVVPPREDSTKAPDIKSWKDFQTTRPTSEQLAAWYRDDRTGLGTVTGVISGGLELFDFDCADTYAAFKETAAAIGLGPLVERIEQGYSERTPDVGIHWFYRCTEIAVNTKLATRQGPPNKQGRPVVEVLIETRGEGGYAVLAPSHGGVHPSGKPYTVLHGAFATIATITPEERNGIWHLAQSFDEMPRREVVPSPQEPSRGQPDSMRPGDDFASRATWEEILVPHGWVPIYERNDQTYWRRPDKVIGVSATTNYQDSDLLYVFSSSTPFEAQRGYNKFSAYSVLEHDGDFSAAARGLATHGYGSPGNARSEMAASNEITRSRVPASPRNSIGEAPRLPIHIFPGAIGDLVREGALALDIPPDFIAVPLLAFAAGALGKRYCIEIKRGFRQWPILYLAVVGPPGSGKTPGADLAREAVDRLQKAAWEQYQAERVRYEAAKRTYDAMSRQERAEQPPPAEPQIVRLYTSDATMEALGQLLEYSPGLVLYRDELVGWVRSHDQYRGKGSDRQKWLEGWSKTPWSIDRKTGPPVYIPDPCVSVFGGIQPDVLPQLQGEAVARDGFIDRIDFSYPAHHFPDETDEEVAQGTLDAVYGVFAKLHSVGASTGTESLVIRLAPAARALYKAWRRENTALLREATGYLQGIRAKLPLKVARCALVLHCLTYPDAPKRREVSELTMRDAIELAEYFHAMARRVLPLLGQAVPPGRENLIGRVAEILDRAQGEWVSRSAIRDQLNRNPSSGEVLTALERLETEGRAERTTQRRQGQPGPAAEVWRATSLDSVDAETRKRGNPRNVSTGAENNTASIDTRQYLIGRGDRPEEDEQAADEVQEWTA